MSKKICDNLGLDSTKEKSMHCYVVVFPDISEHNHATSGELANFREIDPKVLKKITELYQSGIRKKRDKKDY
ncbi:hypothetical protein GDO86_006324 [Hymenochirus boettgeri]|uniref:Uncharacterized protein n=1 Tax=Hymenochirus boettgeri TaxID=247094 RepID=A0A8T2JD70_9PIPI|nr:hypothetical protein GDO86_006324 [Hymenochirus boettgeri]